MWSEDKEVFKKITHFHYKEINIIIEEIENLYKFYLLVGSDEREIKLKNKLRNTFIELYDILALLKTDEK